MIRDLVYEIHNDTGKLNKYVSIFRFFQTCYNYNTYYYKKHLMTQILIIISVYTFLDDVLKPIYTRYTMCNPMIIQGTIV